MYLNQTKTGSAGASPSRKRPPENALPKTPSRKRLTATALPENIITIKLVDTGSFSLIKKIYMQTNPEEINVPHREPGSTSLSPDQPERKHPVHGVIVDPFQPSIVFLTVCCKNRIPWLASKKHHALLREVWVDQSHWSVGRYVIMPDHLHLVAALINESIPFDNWVKYFKSQFTRKNKNPACVWQADHWDTRIRSELQFQEIVEYMTRNPVTKGLVLQPGDWEFQGQIHSWTW